jgi:arylsulfatase A-like enzyme
LTDRAIQWVKNNAEQDGFFWLHYFDPHIPYMPPTEFLPTDPRQRAMGSLFWDVKLARGGSVARSAEERAWIRALYDGEVRYVDAQVGRLLDALKELGIYDDALIVLTSDHGEEFWDHGHFEHGHTLFNELIRVPLLVKLPANREGKTVDAFVTTQAVTPTILDVCGVAPNAAGALPPPLSPLLGDMPEPVAAQPLFSGSTLFQDPAESVVFDGMKYIRTTLSGRELLFNLKEDPKELDSVAVQDPESLARGRQLLDAELAAAPALAEKLGIHTVAGDQLDPRDILNLQTLGYL